MIRLEVRGFGVLGPFWASCVRAQSRLPKPQRHLPRSHRRKASTACRHFARFKSPGKGASQESPRTISGFVQKLVMPRYGSRTMPWCCIDHPPESWQKVSECKAADTREPGSMSTCPRQRDEGSVLIGYLRNVDSFSFTFR